MELINLCEHLCFADIRSDDHLVDSKEFEQLLVLRALLDGVPVDEIWELLLVLWRLEFLGEEDDSDCLFDDVTSEVELEHLSSARHQDFEAGVLSCEAVEHIRGSQSERLKVEFHEDCFTILDESSFGLNAK